MAVAYHRRQMISAWNDVVNDRQPSMIELFHQQVMLGQGTKRTIRFQLERYEYHRNKVVQWGELAHREFLLQHIVKPSDEAEQLWRRLQQAFPDNIHVTSTCPRTPEPMRIEVWDHPSRMSQWEAFMAEHDVSDFRTRFRPTSDEDSTKDTQDGHSDEVQSLHPPGSVEEGMKADELERQHRWDDLEGKSNE